MLLLISFIPFLLFLAIRISSSISLIFFSLQHLFFLFLSSPICFCVLYLPCPPTVTIVFLFYLSTFSLFYHSCSFNPFSFLFLLSFFPFFPFIFSFSTVIYSSPLPPSTTIHFPFSSSTFSTPFLLHHTVPTYILSPIRHIISHYAFSTYPILFSSLTTLFPSAIPFFATL